MRRELKKPPLWGSMGEGDILSTSITQSNPMSRGSRELIHTDAPMDLVVLLIAWNATPLAAEPLHP